MQINGVTRLLIMCHNKLDLRFTSVAKLFRPSHSLIVLEQPVFRWSGYEQYSARYRFGNRSHDRPVILPGAVFADRGAGSGVWSDLGQRIGDFMANLVYGAIIMGSFVIFLFFLNFWRRVRDRFFLFFSFAFLLLAVNWLILVLAGEASDVRSYGYLTRLMAFLLIIVAIVDKNRSRSEAK